MECDCGEIMEITEEDSRQEWCETTYSCPTCNKTKTQRTEFNQNGLVISDKIIEE